MSKLECSCDPCSREVKYASEAGGFYCGEHSSREDWLIKSIIDTARTVALLQDN